MEVLLKGMPNIPRGRLEGMGPYEPSCLFKNFLWVLGVPTCEQHTALGNSELHESEISILSDF